MAKRKKYVVGIDAGVKTGVAIFNREVKKITYRGTGDFWAVFNLIKNFHAPGDSLIVIERPRKGFAYERNQKNSAKVVEMIAFKSGENNRESSLLVAGLEDLGFEVRQVTPVSAKWSATDLKRYTGITERSNEHERDAIKLVFGL